MRILLKKNHDRYGFIVATNHNRTIYSSFTHYFLTPGVNSGYQYAWEACRDAWKLAHNYPYHIEGLRFARYDMEDPVNVDVSAEDMLQTHYLAIYKGLRLRAKGAGKDKEERKKAYQEIKMVINELNSIIEKLTDSKDRGKMGQILKYYQALVNKYLFNEKREDKEEIGGTKLASCVRPEFDEHAMDDEAKIQLLDDYAQRCCVAIQDKHPDAFYVVNSDLNEITLLDFENHPMIKVRINDYLNVDSIIPTDKLYELYPFHSMGFYQKYWKPIVESLGHFCLGNPLILIKVDQATLPDVPSSDQSYTLEGWDCKEKQNKNIDIVFQGEKPTWFFSPSNSIKTAQVKTQEVSSYTEQDYANAVVKCIDKNLESIYGRTGSVERIMPLENMVELDVNFGRGLGIVRLTEPQIQIVL